MSWLQKLLPPKINRAAGQKRMTVPEGLWSKCPSCASVLYASDLQSNANVCPKCSYHNRLSARPRLDLLLDSEGRFEIGAEVQPLDTLKFKDSKKYPDRLKQALDAHGFDAAFGGGRRDEEKSRAKERILSFRSADHVWDPRNQRPELWNLFNTRLAPGQTMRVFPLSNWTEIDVWSYIAAEELPIVPLYLAAEKGSLPELKRVIVAFGNQIAALADDMASRPSVALRTLKRVLNQAPNAVTKMPPRPDGPSGHRRQAATSPTTKAAPMLWVSRLCRPQSRSRS